MNAPKLWVRIARKTWETTAICVLELVPLDGRPFPIFSAGSHIDFHIGARLVRQYSLCNSPAERNRYVIAVLRDPRTRGGSQVIHDEICEGDIVAISEPRNHFALVEDSRRSLLFGGGIGVTPLLSMMQQLAWEGRSFELHYCVRSRACAAFADTLHAPRLAGYVHIHTDDDSDTQLDLATLLRNRDLDTHIYVCGPSGFIDWVLDSARALGWRAANLHFEAFGAENGTSNVASAFDVELARSGLTIHVPAEKSVADALLDAGVYVPLSCEQGVCGTCVVRVLGGEPDHQDMYLSDAEKAMNDQFTPCCSRAKSAKLVIDL